ncbi:MAG TPA: FlgD immunoglobulin-like domain containing protein, partial [Candidatus Edwardsbacteria bacterium]|nr:FlgD immunoglobulin-like domain containing protein [Candidatus Edwardsbacteria bacterium]
DDNAYANSFIHGDYLTNALAAGGWAYDWWSTTDNGQFTTTQLKQYKAVFFQVAQDGPQGGNYPSFTPAQRETIKLYHDGGGRFAMTANDLGWDTWTNQVAGPDLQADTMFGRNYLHFTYKGDIGNTAVANITPLYGMTGDPISGTWTGGVTHQPWRSGAGGDSIWCSGRLAGYNGAAGTYADVWKMPRSNDTCGVRWESNANMGSLGSGIWGGYHTRVVHNAFEITQLDTTSHTSTTRRDILNNMFIWLIGHNHPVDTIQTPVAATTYTTSPISIAWRSTAQGGATIDTTWVEYSNNEGSSWNLLTSGHAVTSPYSWDISALENGTKYQVRVRVKDTGVYPAMAGYDTVGNFTIMKASGGDFTGPIVMPGTIALNLDPVANTAPLDSLFVSAVITDSTTGLSNIAAAKCSLYVGGTALVYNMSGAWNAPQLTVRDTIVTLGWAAGTYKLYVMGADNSAKALRWGAIDSSMSVTIANNLHNLSVSFTMALAQTSPDGIELVWQTASESESYQWLIERGASENGPFAQIAALPAAGNSYVTKEYRYKDAAVSPGAVYYYRIVELNQHGERALYGPIHAQAQSITSFALAAGRPNPFSTELKIKYQLPVESNVSLAVYNITGQRVRSLQNGVQPAAYYTATWDGKDDNGKAMPNGVYFYKLKANSVTTAASFESIKRATLIK